MQDAPQDQENMVAIDVSDFIPGTVLPVDIFIQLSAEKFVQVANQGDKAQLRSLNAVKNKNIQRVHVRKEDYSRFISQTLEIVSFTQKNDKFRLPQKTFFLRSASAAVFQQLEEFGPSPAVLNYAKTVAQTTMDMVENQKSLTAIIAGLQMSSPDVFNVSLAISAFSVMIGKQMNWESRITFEKLSLGGLLADVGLKELSPELLDKPRAEMSHDEIQKYEEHPYRGLKMLESVGGIPDDVLSIVYEHHENSAGMGYPRRLRGLRLNPLAKVVGLASEFCELTIKTPKNPNPRSVHEALHHIEVVLGQPFDKEAFRALKQLVAAEKQSEAG